MHVQYNIKLPIVKGTPFLSMVVIVTHIPQILSSEYEIFRCTLLLLGNSSQCLDRLLLYIYVCVLVLRPPNLSCSALSPQQIISSVLATLNNCCVSEGKARITSSIGSSKARSTSQIYLTGIR